MVTSLELPAATQAGMEFEKQESPHRCAKGQGPGRIAPRISCREGDDQRLVCAAENGEGERSNPLRDTAATGKALSSKRFHCKHLSDLKEQ
jgi:hypothetical protein